MSNFGPQPPLTVLFLGATGYIGASVLDRLIHRPAGNTQAYKIVCYVRNQDKAQKLLEGFGISSIIGTLEDSQKLEDAAALADVVINTASADHLASVQAVLRGLKRKFEKSGRAPVYIHTSGTGVFADDANGAHGNAPTYDDTNIAQLKAIPDDAPHRPMELAALAADEAGYARSYIVMPPVVFGLASGPLFDAKLAGRHSILLPIVINSAIARKRAGMFGAGRNVWPLCHVNDMADLYVLVFSSVLSVSAAQPAPGHGWEGFYFAENGSFVFKDLSVAVGHELEKMGKVTDVTPSAYTREDLDKFYAGGEIFGSNSICTSKRARALGWAPKYGTEDFFASVAPEVGAIVSSSPSAMGNKLTSTMALVESARAASKMD